MQVIVQDLLTEYVDEGSGRALLLLHGWGDTLHTFDELTRDLLSAEYRVIRLDLPGFGKSESPKKVWDLNHYVEFVSTFLEKIGVTQVSVLVGHSFGGRVAIKGLAEQKLATERLVLIGAAGVTPRHNLRTVPANIVAKVGNIVTFVPPFYFWRAKLRKWFYRSLKSDYENAGHLKGTFVNIVKETLENQASKVLIPTLLIWGSSDSETPVDDGNRLTTLIPNSSLVIIPNAGHFVHQEHPHVVSQHIREFNA